MRIFFERKKKNILIPKIQDTTKVACLIEEYNYAHHFNKRFKLMKIFIFITYFFCWFYILIKSLPNLNLILLIDYLHITSKLLDNPFSEEIIGLRIINKITLKNDFITIFSMYEIN